MQTHVTPEERDALLAGIEAMFAAGPTPQQQAQATLQAALAQVLALATEGGREDYSDVLRLIEDAEAELSLIIAHPTPEPGEEERRQWYSGTLERYDAKRDERDGL